MTLDHRLHLDDARGEFEEPQAQRIELRDAPHRTLGHRHAQTPHDDVDGLSSTASYAKAWSQQRHKEGDRL